MPHIPFMQRRFACAAASLFAVGAFTGIWSAAAMTGKVQLILPRLALSAHLNALMGSFWLLGVAFTLPWLGYSQKRVQQLYYLTIVPAWANWLITLVASFLGVNGLAYTGDLRNDFVAVLLQLFVVLPTLVSSVFWVRGFFVDREKGSMQTTEPRSATR